MIKFSEFLYIIMFITTQLNSTHKLLALESRILFNSFGTLNYEQVSDEMSGAEGVEKSDLVRQDLQKFYEKVNAEIKPNSEKLFTAAVEKADSIDDIESAVDNYSDAVDIAVKLAEKRNEAIANLVEGDLLSESEKEELFGSNNPQISPLFAEAQTKVQELINLKKQYDISADVFDVGKNKELHSLLHEKIKEKLEDYYNDLTDDLTDAYSADFDEMSMLLGKYSLSDPAELVPYIQSQRDKVFADARTPDINSVMSQIYTLQGEIASYKKQLKNATSSALRAGIVSADIIKSQKIAAEVSDLKAVISDFNTQDANVNDQRKKIDTQISTISNALKEAEKKLQSTETHIHTTTIQKRENDDLIDKKEDAYIDVRKQNDVYYFTSKDSISADLQSEMQENLYESGSLLQKYNTASFKDRVTIEEKLKEDHNISLENFSDAQKTYNTLYSKYKLLQNDPMQVEEYKTVLQQINKAKNSLDAAKLSFEQSKQSLEKLKDHKEELQDVIDAKKDRIEDLKGRRNEIKADYEKGFWSWFSSSTEDDFDIDEEIY